MIESRIPNQYQRHWWVGRTIVALLIAILGFYSILYQFSEVNTQTRLQATGIFTSALLTFLLIAIYRDMSDIQSQQAKVMANQERLMEIQYEPEILVNRWWLDSEGISLVLSNAGEGLGKSLGTLVVLEPATEEAECPPEPDLDLSFLFDARAEIEASESRDLIFGGDRNQEFRGRLSIHFPLSGGGTFYAWPSSPIPGSDDCDYVFGHFYLFWKNKLGKLGCHRFHQFWSDWSGCDITEPELREDGMTLEELMFQEEGRHFEREGAVLPDRFEVKRGEE